MNKRGNVLIASMVIIAVIAIVAAAVGLPKYNVWRRAMKGQAELREAEWSRKILIEEAEAEKKSEVLRAEGVAEANKIIGESLSGNDEYLKYLWITGLHDERVEVIYIPTEAGLPILEAGRIGKSPQTQ